MRRIYSGTLPGFPQHLRVTQVQQELPIVDDHDELITPVTYILKNNTSRNLILKQIETIENQDIDGIQNFILFTKVSYNSYYLWV